MNAPRVPLSTQTRDWLVVISLLGVFVVLSLVTFWLVRFAVLPAVVI